MTDTEKQMTPLSELIQRLKANQELFQDWTIEYSILKLSIDQAQSLLPNEKQMLIDAYNIEGNSATGEEYFNEKYL